MHNHTTDRADRNHREGRGGGTAKRADAAPLGNTRNFTPCTDSAAFRDGTDRDGVLRWDWQRTYRDGQELANARQQLARLERWMLQAAAVEVMRGDDEFLRLAKCCKVPLGRDVAIAYSAKAKRASYRKLTTCGSVWVCPICAAKITEKRRVELTGALEHWREQGGAAVLMTLTFPHRAWHSLKPMLGAASKAIAKFWKGATMDRIKASYGIVGQVRALEVTHGANGWHPHFHILLVLGGELSDVQLRELESHMYQKWARACEASGLEAPSRKHGCRLDADWASVSDYVTKGGWSIEAEMTKAAVKQGRGSGRSPMGLLRDFFEDGDAGAADLFREYARAFKGKAQLVWSRGLRDMLALGREKTDEELAAERETDDEVVLASIPLPVWRLVLRHHVRGLLLEVASGGDQFAVWQFLGSLPGAQEVIVACFATGEGYEDGEEAG